MSWKSAHRALSRGTTAVPRRFRLAPESLLASRPTADALRSRAAATSSTLNPPLALSNSKALSLVLEVITASASAPALGLVATRSRRCARIHRRLASTSEGWSSSASADPIVPASLPAPPPREEFVGIGASVRGCEDPRACSGADRGVPRGVRAGVTAAVAPEQRRLGAPPLGVGSVLVGVGSVLVGVGGCSVRGFRGSSTSRSASAAEPGVSRAPSARPVVVWPVMSTTTLMRLLLLLRLRFRRRERPEAHEPAAALDALLEGLDATLLGRRRAIAVSRHRWFNTGRLPGGSPGWCRANCGENARKSTQTFRAILRFSPEPNLHEVSSRRLQPQLAKTTKLSMAEISRCLVSGAFSTSRRTIHAFNGGKQTPVLEFLGPIFPNQNTHVSSRTTGQPFMRKKYRV